MWIDHRSVRKPDEPPPQPVAPPSDDLGRGPDGRSRRLATCVAGPRQPPPRLRRRLHQKISFAKKMRSRREIGDLMLETSSVGYKTEDDTAASFEGMDIPSVDYLMDCPLSKFIHLAANDCGFTGSRRDLVTG